MAPLEPLSVTVSNEDKTVPASANPANFLRVISGLTIAMVSMLGVCSFVLSFEALRHFASESGALNPAHAWLFPIMVDGSIVVFSISALRCSIVGDDTQWSMALVVLSTAASVLFNMAHAPGGFMPALIGATPPVLLFLSFESLMRQISSSLGGKHSPLTTLLPSFKIKAMKKTVRPGQVEAPAAKPTDERKVKARQLLASGVSKRQVAREVGMGIGTVRRLAATLTATAQA
jgi:hypothetical protein